MKIGWGILPKIINNVFKTQQPKNLLGFLILTIHERREKRITAGVTITGPRALLFMEDNKCNIPQNFNGLVSIPLLGFMVRKRNILEASIVTIPCILFIFFSQIVPLLTGFKITMYIFLPLFIILTIGINDGSWGAFIKDFFLFKKHCEKAYFNPRVKFESRPLEYEALSISNDMGENDFSSVLIDKINNMSSSDIKEDDDTFKENVFRLSEAEDVYFVDDIKSKKKKDGYKIAKEGDDDVFEKASNKIRKDKKKEKAEKQKNIRKP